MNKYEINARQRSRTLLIVEGNHEKNKLFRLLLETFPEIRINMDDIWIYGTNIYLLYEDIAKEYGVDWTTAEADVDLPFVISKKQYPNAPEKICNKVNFTNILLVFDYERQDSNFSAEKIMEMQKFFYDETDMGKLYINYPMIESYQHLKGLPDVDYAERKILASMRKGKEYKRMVERESIIKKWMQLPQRIEDLMYKRFRIEDAEKRKQYLEQILQITQQDELVERLDEILQGSIQEKETLKFQLQDWLLKVGHLENSKSYYGFMRQQFCKIIKHNICKANKIQNNRYEIEMERYKECFEKIDLLKILQEQNTCSADMNNGHIWVLNTCVFFVAEYQFSLILE